jgi:hypothetical protein
MTWTVAPAPPERMTGPGWFVPGEETSQPPTGGGWFALLEKVAPLNGGGTLAVAVRPHVAITAAFGGDGAVLPALAPRNWRTVALSGTGELVGTFYETRSRAAAFSGSGAYDAEINDGLSASIQAGIAARLSGDGALTTVITGGMSYPDGLSAIIVFKAYTYQPSLAGGGSLSATVEARVIAPVSAALSGGGTLSATVSARYASSPALGGGGTLSAAVVGTVNMSNFLDEFIRADSTTSAGPAWTNRYNTLGVSGNAAYATGSGDGSWGIATPNVVMVNDDMEASVIVKAPIGGNDYTLVGLGLNEAGQGAFYHCNGVGHYIYSQVTWYANWTMVAAVTSTAVATNDRLTVRRVGNVYTGLLNGVVMVSWTDSGNTIPRDSSHRLLEMGIYPGSRPADTFMAASGGVFDDFNRANANTLGHNWIQRKHSIGIVNGAAYPSIGTDWNNSTHITPMPTNDAEVSIVLAPIVGSTSTQVMLQLGCNESGQGAVYYSDGWTHYIISQADWNNSWTVQVQITGIVQPDGGTMTFRRIGNVYTGYLNGVLVPGLTWTDSGNVIPRDANHRLVGMIGYSPDVTPANYRMATSFTARGL